MFWIVSYTLAALVAFVCAVVTGLGLAKAPPEFLSWAAFASMTWIMLECAIRELAKRYPDKDDR
jgi:hypothetical protein